MTARLPAGHPGLDAPHAEHRPRLPLRSGPGAGPRRVGVKRPRPWLCGQHQQGCGGLIPGRKTV